MLETPVEAPEAHVPETNVVVKKKKVVAKDFVVYGAFAQGKRRQYIASVKSFNKKEAIAKISTRFQTVSQWNAAPKPKNFNIKSKFDNTLKS